MEKKYRYLGYFMLLLIPLIFAGFYKSYIGQIPDFTENITIYMHIHALIATAWIAMLIAQPLLILNKKTALHRAIGKLSYIVFPLLVLSFIPQIIRNIDQGQMLFLFYPLADGTLLVVFYSLAIYNRKKSPMHMRFMIANALVFLGPTIGRIGPSLFEWSLVVTQNVQYTIIYSILLGLILYDRANNRKYTPYLVAVGCYAVHQAVFYIIYL
jgi:uncharacterized membrane protein HdeD (DUF308 family)